MPWERITHDRQTRQDLRRLLGDVGFYLDHDVDSVVAQMLLWLKHDVETAADVGAESQRDEWHFRRAFETKRVLITKDKDYLDHERFPLSQTCGVIIMNIDTSSEREIARALEVIHFVLARLRQTMVGSKVVLNSDYTLTLVSRVPDTDGFSVRKTRYRVHGDGTDVWIDE